MWLSRLSWLKRLSVIIPAFSLASVQSVQIVLSFQPNHNWSFSDTFSQILMPVLGPLAIFIFPYSADIVLIYLILSVIFLPMVLAHPIWLKWWAAILTTIGAFILVFLGKILVYSEV
jgi:hypothetical protein